MVLFRQQVLFLALLLLIRALPGFYLRALPGWSRGRCRWQRGICFRLISGRHGKRGSRSGKEGTGNRLSGRSTRADFTLCATRTRARACPKGCRTTHGERCSGHACPRGAGTDGYQFCAPPAGCRFLGAEFSAGATLPLVVAWLSPATLVFLFVILSSLFSLAALGYISSIVSRASPVRAIGRITFWSTTAMLSSMGIGHLAGQVLF